jgi:hypothetical protein
MLMRWAEATEAGNYLICVGRSKGTKIGHHRLSCNTRKRYIVFPGSIYGGAYSCVSSYWLAYH